MWYVAGLVALAALWLPERAAAQDPYCLPCQAGRWQSIEKIMLARAQRLKAARGLLRDAEQRGDPALVKKAQAYLESISRQWEEIYGSAQALGSPSYKAHLAKNLVDVEVSYDVEHAAWQKKVAQFKNLQGAIGERRKQLQDEIDGILKEEAEQRWRLGFNGVFNALKAGAVWAEHAVAQPGLDAAASQAFNRLIGAQRAAELGKAGYAAHEGHYWEAGAEAGDLALHVLVPASARLHPVVVAAVPVATLGLDLAAVGLSHVQWRAAQDRREDVRSAETKWQIDLALAAARVQNLKREREMAADAIDRQRAFEAQFASVRAEMP
jgi:hypothetical protein